MEWNKYHNNKDYLHKILDLWKINPQKKLNRSYSSYLY